MPEDPQDIRDITSFLTETVKVIDEFKNTTEITRLERVTELYVKNHFDFDVKGWGIIESADPKVNPYGAFGLNIDEALELIRYESFILGILYVANPEKTEDWMKSNVFDKMEAELKLKREKMELLIKAEELKQTTETTENNNNTNDNGSNNKS